MFCYLRKSSLYLLREQVLLHRIRHFVLTAALNGAGGLQAQCHRQSESESVERRTNIISFGLFIGRVDSRKNIDHHQLYFLTENHLKALKMNLQTT